MLRRSPMMGSLIVACALLAEPATASDGGCACVDENWTGSCTASIRQDGRWIFIESSSKSCSRVEWLASEERRMTMVSGGEDIQEWSGQPDQPALRVERCNVCEAGAEKPDPPATPRDSGSTSDQDSGSASREDERAEKKERKRSSGRSPFQGT